MTQVTTQKRTILYTSVYMNCFGDTFKTTSMLDETLAIELESWPPVVTILSPLFFFQAGKRCIAEVACAAPVAKCS
ncbi:MAG: hypothetical protein EA411_08095 [Saprospirales bacterium]|nr:MAG: hypothetical protein EA411_08095 [Saprospirales bacterium]